MDLIWRPTRRVFVVAALWSLLAVVCVFGIAGLGLTGAVYLLIASVLLGGYYLLLGLRGCTEVTDEAVHNTVLRTADIPWDEVDGVRVVRFGRARWLHLVVDRRKIRLAAPRTGLIARDPDFADRLAELEATHEVGEIRVSGWLVAFSAVGWVLAMVVIVAALDRPWLSDWWPGVRVATQTPAPCGVLDGPALDRALTEHHDAGTPTKSFLGDGCQWQRLGDLDWDLVVSYDRFTRSARRSAADEAADGLATYAGHEDQRPVPGLGDQAYVRTSGAITSVLVRKANVLVELEYNGDARTAVELARTATAAVQLD